MWTCRAGFEAHLFEELAWAKGAPKLLGEALLESDPIRTAPAFGRQAFRVDAVVPAAEVRAHPKRGQTHVWSLDTDEGNRLGAQVAALHERLVAERAGLELTTGRAAYVQAAPLFQVCLLDHETAAVGQVLARDAASLAPGGRERMRREADAVSRAASKLEEAFTRLGFEPEGGDLCVDLGAAPGGWAQRLLARGARVVAVDPAAMQADLAKNKKLMHVRGSAFVYAPEERIDWLCCDMAWRPLEVAQLLGKWARRGWARFLVANLKLPMQDKNPIILRARHVLHEAGWEKLEIRQLYHDRDEVTVTARIER